jgi:hypothetical protein
MHYLKDMKNESIDILLHPRVDAWCKENDIDVDNLAVVEDEKLLTFKDLILANRTRNIRGLGKTMDTLIDNLIDIASKKVP